MTFTNYAPAVATIRSMLLQSREAVVNYMTPLGLAHIMATGHHYGRRPGSTARAPTGRRRTTTRRTRWAGFRPHRHGQQRRGSVRRAGPRPVRQPVDRPRTRCSSGSTGCRGPIGRTADARCGTSSSSVTTPESIPCGRCRSPSGHRSGQRRCRAFAEVAKFLDIQEREARWGATRQLTYFQQYSRCRSRQGTSSRRTGRVLSADHLSRQSGQAPLRRGSLNPHAHHPLRSVMHSRSPSARG
jgi:alpha-glucuronidase